MPCELEIEGQIATLRTIVREPDLEGFMLEQRDQLSAEVKEEIGSLLAERFGGRIEISYVSVEPAGSVAVLVVLSTVGHMVIEFGALMAGLRELSRLVPDRIQRILSRRFRAPERVTLRGVKEPAEVVLGPTVLSAIRPRRSILKGERADDLRIALSAAGGAILVIVGMLLGRFL
jgi:hypothetical protein